MQSNSALHLTGIRAVRNCLAGLFPGTLRVPTGKPAAFPPEALPGLLGPQVNAKPLGRPRP